MPDPAPPPESTAPAAQPAVDAAPAPATLVPPDASGVVAREKAWHAVAQVAALRPNDVVAATVAGVDVIVGLDATTGAYFALQRRCVHQGGDLADGIVSRGHVVCPVHGWRFSTATGCHDTASSFCLARYPVRVAGDTLEIEL